MDFTTRPHTDEFPSFYHGYVAEARGADLLEALELSRERMRMVTDRVSPEKETFRYAPEKWSICEVLQHVIDCERIFAYRALRFARKDVTELPGFEENDYAAASEADRRTLKDLMAEYDLVRDSSIILFKSLPAGALVRSGNANGRPITVRAIGWSIAGHSNHHASVLEERYLKNL